MSSLNDYLYVFFLLKFTDSEGDRLTIVNALDFSIFQEGKYTKVFVEVKTDGDETSLTQERPAVAPIEIEATVTAVPNAPESWYHPNVVCDACDQPIIGFRYKCIECIDYDLCMECEPKMLHEQHVMMRLPRPNDSDLCRPKLMKRFARVRRSESEKHQHKEKKPHKHHKRGESCALADLSKFLPGNPGIWRPISNDQSTQASANATANASAQATNQTSTANAATQANPIATVFQELPRLISGIASNARNVPVGQCQANVKQSIDVLSNIAQNFATMMDPFSSSFAFDSNGIVARSEPKKPEEKPTETSSVNKVAAEQDQPKKAEIVGEASKPQEQQEEQVAELSTPKEDIVTIEDIDDDDDSTMQELVRRLNDFSPKERTDDAEKKMETENEKSPSREWTLLNAEDLEGPSTSASTGAIPKRSSLTTDSASNKGVYAEAQQAADAQKKVEQFQYADFARLLESHIRSSEIEKKKAEEQAKLAEEQASLAEKQNRKVTEKPIDEPKPTAPVQPNHPGKSIERRMWKNRIIIFSLFSVVLL